MKEIKAVIQPSRLSRVREALRKVPGFPGMTITAAEGCSDVSDLALQKRDTEELVEFSRKVRVEIVSPDEHVDEMVRIIHELCHTGQRGDGIVWVTPVDTFSRLRER
ncbi:MAG: P-II family nitrogen regulator [Burkholderiales bacterium]|nr:P-II family nitrogen regulator [Burkholderiales bacterium]